MTSFGGGATTKVNTNALNPIQLKTYQLQTEYNLNTYRRGLNATTTLPQREHDSLSESLLCVNVLSLHAIMCPSSVQ